MSNRICNSCIKELKNERYKTIYDFSEIKDPPKSYRENEFKRTYNNQFLYLTYLFRNGKILVNNNKKIINNDNAKKSKIIIKEINEIKKKNNENNLYNNRTDPHNEAYHLIKFLKKNQKKFASNEKFLKTFSGFIKILKSNENGKRKGINNKNQLKYYYNNCVREGFFGRKNKDNLPNFYPSISVSQNEYASKSEKERHEKLLEEIGKLNFFLSINKDKENKLRIIKDFLIKFHIIDLNNYTDEQLLNIEKFINEKNFIVEPFKDIKTMIKNTLDGKNNTETIKNVSKSLNYISPNIPMRIKRKSKSPPKKINIYENMDLERQKKFFLQNINYNNDYNKIYKEFHTEIMNLTNNRYNNTPSILNNDSNKFNFITSFKYKVNTLNMNNESINNISSGNNTSRNLRKDYFLDEITDRLYYKQIRKPFEIEEIKRYNKLTEYVVFNKARNKIFEKELKNLFED